MLPDLESGEQVAPQRSAEGTARAVSAVTISTAIGESFSDPANMVTDGKGQDKREVFLFKGVHKHMFLT